MERLAELPSARFNFPPGFRFHPSDQELIIHYLQNKVTSHPLPATVIAEIDLYKYNPWELPKKALFGDEEWYFFSPRDRKYPNGARPNRAAASGYWKATGTDKPILVFGESECIGVKKSLVFYTGRPPKGIKTDWIMNEYRLPEAAIKPSRLSGSMRLDNWVLCRVRLKGNVPKHTDNQDKPNPELTEHSGKVEIASPTSKCLIDTNMDHLYRHCKVIGTLLAGQSLPDLENISRISSQGCGNSTNEVSTIYNTLKRVSPEETWNGDFIQPKKQRVEGYAAEIPHCGKLAGTSQYSESKNQKNIFNLQSSDSMINFEELNGWAFN